MQVKCDYCGSWMEDSDEKCPNCSAANANLVRVANKTPQTIGDLIAWYKARNLPPFEKTRFFIGENYKGAKAFGIYEDGGEYIVYKNKADGSRAIRYRGKDEAYAVNEIYLRLKEEILNQKNVSQAKKGLRSIGTTSGAYTEPKSSSVFTDFFSSLKGCRRGCLQYFLIAMAALFALAGLGTIIEKVDEKKAKAGSYYLSDDKRTIFYCAGYNSSIELRNTDYEWWCCDAKELNWTLYDVRTDKNHFPVGLDKDNRCGIYGQMGELWQDLGIEYSGETLDVNNPYNVVYTRAYKDFHHSAPGTNSYYYVNGQSYYHLNDSHSSYGDYDNHTGWYIYDDGWEYYCSDDDHGTLGDDLWYDSDKYEINSYDTYQNYVSGSIYDFSDTEAMNWDVAAMASDFSQTQWYSEKSENDAAYDKYWEEHSSSSSSSSSDWSSSSSSSDWSSSDSDWDWDSSDSWDSGSSDWDSDW